MSIFEQASRMALRFDTPKGQLSSEDLWGLPLQSATGKANLDTLAVDLDHALKNSGATSFVDAAKGEDKVTRLRFDIVKHIIDVRLAERDAAQKRADLAEQKQKLLGILSEKQDADLRNLSTEEIKKKLDELSV